MDRNLSGATTPRQSSPGGDGNEEVLCIPQSSSITEASSSDCLELYPGQSLGKSYLSAEIQSVYSTTRSEWAKRRESMSIPTWMIIQQQAKFEYANVKFGMPPRSFEIHLARMKCRVEIIPTQHTKGSSCETQEIQCWETHYSAKSL